MTLAGVLHVGVAVSCQVADVGGGEQADAAPEVALQLPVGAVGERGLLEGVDLTHDLRYSPRDTEQKRWTGGQTGRGNV